MKKRYTMLLLLNALNGYCQTISPRQDIDIQHYIFKIAINDSTDQIQVEASVRIFFKQNLKEFSLDLIGEAKSGKTGMRVREVSFLSIPINFKQTDNSLIITLPNGTSANATKDFKIKYAGVPEDGLIISKNKFGERTFFGDNWPQRACYWLPVIDHPSDKATCEFWITAPLHYKVVANGMLREESNIENNQRLTVWQETVPIPTKVMVFAAARFAVQQNGSLNCVPISSWSYPQDKDKIFFDYGVANDILKFFEQKIGTYPYEKLANVQSTTHFGGMENASNIFYSEHKSFGRNNIEMIGLMAHEIAHQWFGNSVTEKDWQHIWLSEGFATYFSALYIEQLFGKTALNKIMAENKQKVIEFIRTKPVSVIDSSQAINPMGLLNANSYERGAWFLHQLRIEIGDDAFGRCIRSYYQKFKNQNANTQDFMREVELATGKGMELFFKQKLQSPTLPEVVGNWYFDDTNKVLTINLAQAQSNLLSLPIDYQLLNDNNEVIQKGGIVLNERNKSIKIKLFTAPNAILFDNDQRILARIDVKKIGD